MKAMNDKSKVYTRLDSIRISDADRRHAYASLRDGELIAELLLRAVADLRALAGYLERGAIGLAHGIRTILAKPVKH